MTQNQTLTKKPLAEIGEEIGIDLAVQFVKDYQKANPSDTNHYIIGRKILEQILSQPGCEGIKFMNAYNEIGEKTLVYVGLNKNGNSILQFVSVNNNGMLHMHPGIVADRTERTGGGITREIPSADDWNWVAE